MSATASGKPLQPIGVTRFNAESYVDGKRVLFAAGTAAVVTMEGDVSVRGG